MAVALFTCTHTCTLSLILPSNHFTNPAGVDRQEKHPEANRHFAGELFASTDTRRRLITALLSLILSRQFWFRERDLIRRLNLFVGMSMDELDHIFFETDRTLSRSRCSVVPDSGRVHDKVSGLLCGMRKKQQNCRLSAERVAGPVILNKFPPSPPSAPVLALTMMCR